MSGHHLLVYRKLTFAGFVVFDDHLGLPVKNQNPSFCVQGLEGWLAQWLKMLAVPLVEACSSVPQHHPPQATCITQSPEKANIASFIVHLPALTCTPPTKSTIKNKCENHTCTHLNEFLRTVDWVRENRHCDCIDVLVLQDTAETAQESLWANEIVIVVVVEWVYN